MSRNLFDSRVVERNIKRGIITKEQYEEFLANLEDCTEEAREVETKFERKVEKINESK